MRRLALSLLALAMLLPPAASLSLAPSAPTLQPGDVPNEVVVSFDGPISDAALAWAQSEGQVLIRNDAIHFLSVRLTDAAAAERFLGSAQGRSDVTLAERDGYVYADFTPNDPLYNQQYAPGDVGLPEAWDITRGSHNTRVAILDTGVMLTHADLIPNLCGPFRAFDGSTTVNDVNGHGTHTSGIAAAAINNAVGIAGASNSCLMHGKVLSNGGSGQWSWLADGITWAADNGARIISMSLGGGGGSGAVQNAAKYAYNTKNVLLVASSGNSGCGSPAQQLGYPAQYDEVVGVGALDPGRFVASYSTCGLDMEITAPGSAVLSTWRTGGYASLSGTSMSAPMVAGAAALVWDARPSLTNHELRCLLNLSADEIALTLPGRDWETGWGVVDPKGAIEMYDTLVAQGLFDEFQQLCRDGARVIMY